MTAAVKAKRLHVPSAPQHPNLAVHLTHQHIHLLPALEWQASDAHDLSFPTAHASAESTECQTVLLKPLRPSTPERQSDGPELFDSLTGLWADPNPHKTSLTSMSQNVIFVESAELPPGDEASYDNRTRHLREGLRRQALETGFRDLMNRTL